MRRFALVLILVLTIFIINIFSVNAVIGPKIIGDEPGLVTVWRGNGTGTDDGSNANDLILLSTAFNNAVYGQGINFTTSGTGAETTSATTSNPFPDGDGTVQFWYIPTGNGPPNGATFLRTRDLDPTDKTAFITMSGGDILIDKAGQTSLFYNHNFEAGVDVHIAVIYTVSNITLMIDGVIANVSFTGSTGYFSCGFLSASRCNIGGLQVINTGVVGVMDDIAVFDFAKYDQGANQTVVFTPVTNNGTSSSTTGNVVNWTTTITGFPPSLSQCWFTHNDSGTFVNETVQNCNSPFIFDQSITLTATTQQEVCGFFTANNSVSGETAQTELSCLSVSESSIPNILSATNNASDSIFNDVVQWTVDTSDNFGLGNYTFGFNDSGSFVNDSLSLLNGELNVTLTANKSVSIASGRFICGRFYIFDLFGNENQSESCFTSTSNLFRVNITAKNIFSNLTINKVNVTAQQIENSSFVRVGSTESGLVTIDLRSGNYTFVLSGEGQSNTTGNRSVTGFQNLTFFMQNASSVFVQIFDEITKQPILDNVTLEFIGSNNVFNFTVFNQSILTNIPGDSYNIRYSNPLYDTREFFFTIGQGASANIILFLLTTGNSSDVDGVVVDQNLRRVENVTVQALRFFLDTNSFEIVSMRKTNFDGQILFHLQELEEFYKFIIIDTDGSILLETTSTIITPLIVTEGLSFQVNLQVSVLGTIDDLSSVSAGVFFNNDTSNFRLTFADASGLVQTGCLTIESVSGFGINTFNRTCVNASSATILIPINGTKQASYIAIGTIQDSTNDNTATKVVVGSISFTISNIPSILGIQTVFYAVSIIIGLGLAAAYNPKTAILASSFSLLIMVMAGLTVISWVAIVSVIGMSIFVSIRMRGVDT